MVRSEFSGRRACIRRRIPKEIKSEESVGFHESVSSPYRYPYGRAVLQEDVEKSETDTCLRHFETGRRRC